MDQLLWERIGELFAEAREFSGDRRLAFLKERCGDDQELLQQVMSLLQADDKSGPLDSAPTLSAFPVPKVIAGRFRIIRYIAEGGMGTVYEAEDLTLGDRVALKTIRPDIVSDARAVQRFKREISLGKKITHPNVCRVHDLGVGRTEDGAEFLFLTMQFLNGETLASRIKRGPIPTSDALPLIEDMTAALSAAHQAEVIHRDFKSGNVMLVNGASRLCAVVTDFGLARQIHDNVTLTQTGMIGTVSYMAPEQIRGEELTPVTDIYALGIVMYEMVTGELPFKGDSNVTIALKHLNEEPKPPRELSPNLKLRLQETILGCLRKAPEDRFRSAAEVKDALTEDRLASRTRSQGRLAKRAVSGRLIAVSITLSLAVAILGSVPSVRQRVERWIHIGSVPHVGQLAVLPLGAPTDDPQSEALEYGLADTLAARLTQLTASRPLQIVPASEIRAKGITNLEQARQEFGVNLGLELSLRRSGDMVRINYGLVDAKTHHEIRADTITAPMSDGFAIEDRVADSVVKALELDLQPQEKELLATHGTDEPVAYNYYLKGRGYLQEYEKAENIESAIAVFHHALEMDSRYASAFSGLGQAYWRKYEVTKDSQWVNKAQEACERALALDANQADGHICLGLVYNGTGNYEEAAHQYQFAIDEEPANDDAIRGLASAYRTLNKTSDAENAYQRAISARPSYWLGYNELGGLYMAVGRYDDAAQMFSRVVDLAPDSFRGYSNLGGAYVALGRYKEAAEIFKHSINIRPTYAAYSNLATAYFQLRQYNEAAASYRSALAIDNGDYIVWGNLADAYYYSGQHSQARVAYQTAITLGEKRLVVNPRDASVLGDLANYHSMIGSRDDAASCLTKALQLSKYKDPDLLFDAAMVHNQLGSSDEALDYLAKALMAGYSPDTVMSAPALDNLHSNTRFKSLLAAANDRRSVAKPKS